MAVNFPPLGSLNRIRASIYWVAFPELNVSAGYLGEPGIRLAFDGDATTMIRTMTGLVTSGEPFQGVALQVPLLKTQNLAGLYENKRKTNTVLGDGTVYPDVPPGSGIGTFDITNCAIVNIGELDFGGRNPIYGVVIQGTYAINNNLFG